MSFSTALSGLNAASSDLNVKSNNIANVNTTGFKQSRAEFGDVFAVSAFGSSSKTAIGSGVVLSNVAQQFNQGNLEFTDNSLDLAISGEGFFAMAPTQESGEIIYTRAGAFGINKDGYMINSGGNFLRTFPVNENGEISATSMSAAKPLQLPASQGAPEATTELRIATNLPSNAEAISTAASPLVGGTFTTTAFTLGDTSSFKVDGKSVVLDGTEATAADVITAVETQLNGATTPAPYTVAYTAGSPITITSNLTATAPIVTADTGTDIVSTGTSINQPPVIQSINPFDPETYNNSTSATVYDSLGNEHIVTTYYQKVDADANGGVDNQWRMEAFISASEIKLPTTAPLSGIPPNQLVQLGATSTMQFNDDGSLNAVTPTDPVLLEMTIAAGTELASGAADLSVALNLNGSTQNSGSFAVGGLTVNGFPTGRLTGVDVSEDGLIRATYSNGQAEPIGKIALANFANVQALNKVGNTAWKETSDSGPVIAGEAATGSFGKIQSGALETSNVDLTKELVGLITAQRNFQANSKSIETFNTITQTIINIR